MSDSYLTIALSEDEMNRCKEFSLKSAMTQQAVEFGQKNTKPRDTKEIARDNMIGKMAEVAVNKMLRRDFGIHYPVNFDIYGRGEWDDCDVQIRSWSIDIKSTRVGRWLLIELNKLRMRQRQSIDNIPDAIFMCRTRWDMEKDEPTGSVELIGCTSINNLVKNGTRIKRGSLLPNTSVKMMADNFGIRIDELNHDWEQIISHMLVSNPPQHYLIPNSF